MVIPYYCREIGIVVKGSIVIHGGMKDEGYRLRMRMVGEIGYQPIQCGFLKAMKIPNLMQ